MNVGRKHKLVRRYHLTEAAMHDRPVVEELLTRANTGSGVGADAAYQSAKIEVTLKAGMLTSHVHPKGKRGKPLTERALNSNRTKSTVRVRAEHIFGAHAKDMGGILVRTIGLARAMAKIGIKNLAYNWSASPDPRRERRATGPADQAAGR